jgi:signal transduction histidine kinase
MVETKQTFSGHTYTLLIFALAFLSLIIVNLQVEPGLTLTNISLFSVALTLQLGILFVLSGLYFYASRFYVDSFYVYLSVGWLAGSVTFLLDLLFYTSNLLPRGFAYYALNVISVLPFYVGSFLYLNKEPSSKKVVVSVSTWIVLQTALWLAAHWIVGGSLTISIVPFAVWTLIRTGKCFRTRLVHAKHGFWSSIIPVTFYAYACLQVLFIPVYVADLRVVLTFHFVAFMVKVTNAIGLLRMIRIDQIRLVEQAHELEEQALRRSEIEDLGYLAAGIAHEVRSPLGIINFEIKALKERLHSNPQMLATVERIQDQMQRIYTATAVITALRGSGDDYSQSMNKTSVDDLLRYSIRAVKKEISLPKVYFRVLCKEGLCVRAYGPMLEQAVINLLKNSVDAIRETGHDHGVIEITSRKDSFTDRICIVVKDNGCGIPEENLASIFTPSFTTKREQDVHQGLGLFISQRIVRVHGGELWIESKVGVGTKVSLWLPRWKHEEVT